jgi:tetratricopeptide (TPR) repeat protein
MFKGIKIDNLIFIIALIMAGVIYFLKNIIPELVLDIIAYLTIPLLLFLLIKWGSDFIKYLKKVKINKQFRRLVDEGTELLNSKQHKKAAEVLEQALVLHPKSAELLGYIGSAYLNLKDYNNAIKFFRKAVDIDKSNYELYHLKGKTEFMLNNISESIKDFDKSLRLNPDNPEVLDAKKMVESSN